MNPQHIREFILAGNALFTVKSLRTMEHYTFKVVRAMLSDDKTSLLPPAWKVSVLSGRDNSKDYRRIGTITNGRFLYMQSGVTSAAKGFAWIWNHLDKCGERFEFNHAGRCGRCGRVLTHPDSIQSGIGPECQDKMAFEAMDGVNGLLDQLAGG